MELNIKHDLDKLEKKLNGLGKKAFKPALNSALNKEGKKQTNAAVKEVSQVQRVQPKKIKERLKITRSNFRTLTYRSSVNVRGITWYSLGAKVAGRGKSKRGVRAGLGRYPHTHIHAFIARGLNNTKQVYVRDVDRPKQVVKRPINGIRTNTKKTPLRVMRVRLYKPFNIAFRNRMKKAKTEVLKTLDSELSWRVSKELNKNA